MGRFIPVWLAALTLLLPTPGCRSEKPRPFTRLSAPRDRDPGRAAPASFPGSDGRRYLTRGAGAFPLYGTVAALTLTCPPPGYRNLYLTVDAPHPGKLVVESPDPGHPPRRIHLRAGTNEIDLTGGFPAGSRLSLHSRGGDELAFSQPLFYSPGDDDRRELVFLISADTLAAAHMSLYGYPRRTTPNLERLANDAVVFRNAFANSSWTVSSHMSLFTSQLEADHRVHVRKTYSTKDPLSFELLEKTVYPLSPAIPTLAELLSEQFPAFGFTGGGNVSAQFGFQRGFDLYWSNGRDMNDPAAADHLFARALAHLSEHPFPRAFYFLHTYQVHAPYQPAADLFTSGLREQPVRKVDFQTDLGGIRGIFTSRPRDFVEAATRLYDSEIVAFDAALGTFLAALKARRLYDRSTIVLLSDHGEEFLEHGSWTHASDLSTSQIWVPLLIKFPGQRSRGRAVRLPVSLVDVMPTLLAGLGVPVPGGLQGRSLLGLISGDSRGFAERTVISSLFRSRMEDSIPGKIALIRGDLKLNYSEPYAPALAGFFLSPPPPAVAYEMFDIAADRMEKNDLLADPAVRPVRSLLMRQLPGIIRRLEKSFAGNPAESGRPLSDELIRQFRALGYI